MPFSKVKHSAMVCCQLSCPELCSDRLLITSVDGGFLDDIGGGDW